MVPFANMDEIPMIDDIEIVSVNSLSEALIFFENGDYPKFSKKTSEKRNMLTRVPFESIV